MTTATIRIRLYRAEDQPWFEQLNREWIEQHFVMEPVDTAVLMDPDTHIIKPGGCILMAEIEGKIAGTVALRRVTECIYEFTKMAVAKEFRGLRIGYALGEAALARAKSLNATSVILYSHTSLVPAISLYRKMGFREVPLDGPYERSDIKMEISLQETIANGISPQ